ncbi:MAG TPA: type II secretion system F family protein [Lacipirellula sp.]
MFPQLFMPSIMLFLLGVVLRISLRLLYGARGPSSHDAVYLFMRTMSWVMLILPTMVFLIATTHWVSIILFIAVFEAVVELVVARRQAHRESAWRLFVMAVGGGQPLAESLRYHQGRFRGIVGRWYRRLVSDLERGAPLVEAIWANRAALPREAPVYANFIAASRAAPEDAARFSQLEDAAVVDLRQHLFQRLAYITTVGAVTFSVLLFVMIKIVPSYQEIYEDYDLELPLITRSFIGFSESFGLTLGVPFAAVFFVLVVGVGVIGVLYLADIQVLRPLLDYLGFSRHRAHVLRLLAESIDRNMTLQEALSQLNNPRFGYPSPLVRRRIAGTIARIEAGHEWTEALRRSQLVSGADAATLRTAQEVGNLPWAMRMLADRKVRLMTFRWGAIQNVAFAAVILLIGLLIFWYAVAMFFPITQMIWNLT